MLIKDILRKSSFGFRFAMIWDLCVTVFLYLIGAVFIVLVALYIYFQFQFGYWKRRNVPHAKPSFPFGNLQGADKLNFGVIFKNLYDEGKHHRFYGTWKIHTPTLFINDLDLIKRVLVGDFMHFHDHDFFTDEKKDPLSGNAPSIILNVSK